MTHTPGPWNSDLTTVSTDYEPDHIRVDGPGITRGGVNYRPRIAHVHFNNEPGERKANARLIAAAPDLLAALVKLTYIATHDQDMDEEDRLEFDKVYDNAVAVIAKAKGQGGMKEGGA